MTLLLTAAQCAQGKARTRPNDGEPPAIIVVYVLGDKVVVTAQGAGDAAEVKVASAAFQAMTPAQVADIVAQTKR